jgi:hypothetical protein
LWLFSCEKGNCGFDVAGADNDVQGSEPSMSISASENRFGEALAGDSCKVDPNTISFSAAFSACVVDERGSHGLDPLMATCEKGADAEGEDVTSDQGKATRAFLESRFPKK